MLFTNFHFSSIIQSFCMMETNCNSCWCIVAVFASDGVSRLGLGLETRLLESRSQRSRLGLERFRYRSRGFRLETLHRLFFYELLQEGAL